MASSSSCIPFALQKQWFEIRDLFFATNCVSPNFARALALAAACEHPDARWLTSVCHEKEVKDHEQARTVFLALGENDARARCFAWRLVGYDGDDDVRCLCRSAELGYSFAQACLAYRTTGEERFKFAQLAALQGERDGYRWLGDCFCDGDGCNKDLEKAKQNFFIAAELGHVFCMRWLGELLSGSDPQRWQWWGLAAKLGHSGDFLLSFSKQVRKFASGSGSVLAMFQIGRALKGNVNYAGKKVFDTKKFGFDSLLGPAKQAIAFFDAQIKMCREAIYAWTQVGIRLKVAKDIRIVVGKLIWNARDQAKYVVNVQKLILAEDSNRCSNDFR